MQRPRSSSWPTRSWPPRAREDARFFAAKLDLAREDLAAAAQQGSGAASASAAGDGQAAADEARQVGMLSLLERATDALVGLEATRPRTALAAVASATTALGAASAGRGCDSGSGRRQPRARCGARRGGGRAAGRRRRVRRARRQRPPPATSS
jgi:hypothetical protein